MTPPSMIVSSVRAHTPAAPPSSESPEPAVSVDEVGAWIDNVDSICGDAIADYQAAKQRVQSGDPVALQVAASVATSRAVTRIRASGPSSTADAAALVKAIAGYADAERELAIAYNKGLLYDTTAENRALERAGVSLAGVAGALGADACAAWADRL